MASSVHKVLSVIMIGTVLVAGLGEAVINCSDAIGTLYINGCMPYMKNTGSLESGCCREVKRLYEENSSTASDRQVFCRCLNVIGTSYPGTVFNNVADMPKKCGLEIDIPHSIDDCSKVEFTWGEAAAEAV